MSMIDSRNIIPPLVTNYSIVAVGLIPITTTHSSDMLVEYRQDPRPPPTLALNHDEILISGPAIRSFSIEKENDEHREKPRII